MILCFKRHLGYIKSRTDDKDSDRTPTLKLSMTTNNHTTWR